MPQTASFFDYAFSHAWDNHDPAIQRQIANATKLWGIKSTDIVVQEWAIVRSEKALSAVALSRLAELLEGVPTALPETTTPTTGFWVGPRRGTMSPWGSKALDLLHRCGVSSAIRIERLAGWQIRDNVKTSAHYPFSTTTDDEFSPLFAPVFDPMTESIFFADTLPTLFTSAPTRPVVRINRDQTSLEKANKALGLALSPEEIDYLSSHYHSLSRDPTDCELMSFAQANSEHCRHKIFRAIYKIDSVAMEKSLFDMIRDTHAKTPQGTKVAYSDNAAVISGGEVTDYSANIGIDDDLTKGMKASPQYTERKAIHHIVFKAETHNHPTGVSPFAGAATGSGGEIRDEVATGRGAKIKGGFCGYITAGLDSNGNPPHLSTALNIMTHAPLGAASFNNEIGRPNLMGFFRTADISDPTTKGDRIAYHKPLMIAGGWGSIEDSQVFKAPFYAKAGEEAWLVQLGGPSFLIGLGGGAASSVNSGDNQAKLDYASVQRANPEMQRRCLEVIRECASRGAGNPILSIHDVGAGGLSNAFTELVDSVGLGAQFSLKAIPCEDSSLSPMELWCNESQERFVLAISPNDYPTLEAIAKRERAPIAVVGKATLHPQLQVCEDRVEPPTLAMDLSLSAVLGNPPQMLRDSISRPSLPPINVEGVIEKSLDLSTAIHTVMAHPTVAAKFFLVTIGDRTVGGLTHREAMVGARQMPVADCAITMADFRATPDSTSLYAGEAVAIGERPLIAAINAPAASRMAIAECVMNMVSAPVHDLATVKLSANWMAAVGYPHEDVALYRAVEAASIFCQALSLSIPVGKDSLSMQTRWKNAQGEPTLSYAPVTLIASAVAPLATLSPNYTPEWRLDSHFADSELLAINLGRAKRLGGSILAQTHHSFGENDTPDINPTDLSAWVAAMQAMRQKNLIGAYHDISDGGLIACLLEMAFASGRGFSIYLDNLCAEADPLDVDGAERDPYPLRGRYQEAIVRTLFAEEIGAVLQIRRADRAEVMAILKAHNLSECATVIGHPSVAINAEDSTQEVRVVMNGKALVGEPLSSFEASWCKVSKRIQGLRDDPQCVEEQYQTLGSAKLFGELGSSFAQVYPTLDQTLSTYSTYKTVNTATAKPRVAILREQGINGQVELSAAFHQAGFTAFDVPLSDLEAGITKLSDFQVLGFPGGFSYGDVLGAGRGMAKSILYNPLLRESFHDFFHRPDTLALGVCNGCQVMSQLKSIIMGAEHWPSFVINRSHRYEARWVMAEVLPTNAVFLQGMEGSKLPIVVSHGEGRTLWQNDKTMSQQAVLRFVDQQGNSTESYPQNPNGSPMGLTGFTNSDGRFTLMMPHPERGFLLNQWSWVPEAWRGTKHGYSPWMQMFINARGWMRKN